MPIPVGTTIGVYEIGPLVGRGGMGEVYRARDTRLKRDVAIKFLPSHLAEDPERVRRFEHEAETLAALNHPNIAAIHALEISNNIRFLVLEFVEGQTLDERIGRTPLPEDEALPIARQICSALAAAHDRGIVHRDLKPANIKIAPDGRVKLLDFGLARMFAAPATEPDLSHSPTITGTAGAHVIAGTAAYMAPEQARGLAVDRRADMWALGCVLFEMLTGRPVFTGDSVTDILAAVVTGEPPMGALPVATSPHLRWLISRCLQKDPSSRFRDAADAAAVLSMTPVETAPAPRTRSRRWMAIGAAAGVVVLAMLGAIVMLNSKPPLPPQPVRFDIPVNAAPATQPMAISPDGRQIAFVGSLDATHYALWLRPLDALEAKVIRGTETAARALVSPVFSPDGRSIAFVGDGKLKRIDVDAGSRATLTSLESQIGGIAWNRDDVVLFASNDHGLRRVSASGGEVVPVTERDTTLDETYHDCPVFLPDDRHFLYLAYSVAKPENRAVYVGALNSKSRTRLMPSDSCATYVAPGFVLFSRGRTIMARPFDAQELKLTGEAVPIADDVTTFANDELAAFAVSDGGTLIYRKLGVPESTRSLVWIDRNGKVSEPIGATIQSSFPLVRLSPDDNFIAFSTSVEGKPDDIWTHDLRRNIRLRLTADPGVDHLPVWSPDGSQLMFDSHRSGKGSALYQVPANGAVAERLFFQPEGNLNNGVNDWSRDGRFLVLQRSPSGSPWSLWGLSLVGERKLFVYKTSAAENVGARLSANGRWLAYTTNESGTSQVVVQPFPDPSGGKWQVSTTGGSHPTWRRDGRELYYINPTGDLVAVEVNTESAFAIGRSTTLFRTALGLGTPGFPYDAAADGMRFVFAIPSGNSTPPITTILNWSSLMKRE